MAKFVITAGHGGTDPGAVSGGLSEAVLMTELRHIVATKLHAAGHEVLQDGTKNVNWVLREALKLIGRAPIAVELHMNASANPVAGGVEVISLPKHKALAKRIGFNIAKALGIKLRGDGGWIDQTQSQHHRLAFVQAGGLIVEVAFISNPEERDRYLGRKWLVAGAIAAIWLA